MQSGTFTSGALSLYYEIHGEGRPVILLNGGPGFSHEYLLPIVDLLPGFRLIFYDQRGTGQSEKSPSSEYTVPANVNDLERLAQALKLDRFVLLGHSWGGMLAQAYTLDHPERVERLILADTFSSTSDVQATMQRMRAAVSPETRAVYEKWERAGLYNGRDRYPEEYQAALDLAYEPVTISVPPPPAMQEMFSKVAYDVYRVMWGEESEFKLTGTLVDFNAKPRLGEIQAPALVIAGASDMPTVGMAQAMAQAIPNARLEIFEHSRHFPFIEEPEKFARVMNEFLAG